MSNEKYDKLGSGSELPYHNEHSLKLSSESLGNTSWQNKVRTWKKAQNATCDLYDSDSAAEEGNSLGEDLSEEYKSFVISVTRDDQNEWVFEI